MKPIKLGHGHGPARFLETIFFALGESVVVGSALVNTTGQEMPTVGLPAIAKDSPNFPTLLRLAIHFAHVPSRAKKVPGVGAWLGKLMVTQAYGGSLEKHERADHAFSVLEHQFGLRIKHYEPHDQDLYVFMEDSGDDSHMGELLEYSDDALEKHTLPGPLVALIAKIEQTCIDEGKVSLFGDSKGKADRIAMIKGLREVYSSTLGLKDAKDLVDMYKLLTEASFSLPNPQTASFYPPSLKPTGLPAAMAGLKFKPL